MAAGSTAREAEQAAPPTADMELRALSTLAFGELARFPAGIREMHLGIASRAFGGAGAAALPAQAIHDAVSRRVYGSLSSASMLAGRAAGAIIERSVTPDRGPLSSTRRGGAAIAVVNGLIGDELERAGSELHQPASVRVDGEAVATTRRSLARAFPTASPRLAIFLHGLMETEFSWEWASAGAAGTYGARLAADLAVTPVYIRYNSGLHISENGRELSALLERLVAAWPVEVRELALVGHSMGGLVARSACHYGSTECRAWSERVRHVVSLGTPHLGAPLEQAVHAAAAALHVLPETRMASSFLRRRSAGIRDLRGGSLVDEDWRGRDPDALRDAACREVPLHAGAIHCFVSASITHSPTHPLGRLLGDMLVLVPSASGCGRTRRIPFEARYGHHLGSAHHFALLNHPQVYERLRGWLSAGGAQGGGEQAVR